MVKEKEFNLSEKIIFNNGEIIDGLTSGAIATPDIKEFLRLLKERVCNPTTNHRVIDKLAGDKLC